jgi:hypothetical protein
MPMLRQQHQGRLSEGGIRAVAAATDTIIRFDVVRNEGSAMPAQSAFAFL